MSGTVYTVASGKGGVGKTTTSVNLAVALWQEGNAVALVDADIGMANLAAVLDLTPEATLHDVLAGRASVDEALVEAQGGNLLVLPGDRALESFANADPRELRAAVDELAERCDYVIVDTGAGLSYEDVLPLGMAHGVLLVTTPDPAAFGDTRKTMEIADLLGAPIRGLVVTRAVEDTDARAIADEIGAELLGTIPEDPAVVGSTVAGNPLESHAPDSAAAGAYRDVAARLLEGDEEWLEAHPREPVATVDEVSSVVEAESDEDAGDSDLETGETVGASTELSEAGAAEVEVADEEAVDAEEAAGIGDLLAEPGEDDEAGEERGPEPSGEPPAGEAADQAAEPEPVPAAVDEPTAEAPESDVESDEPGSVETDASFDSGSLDADETADVEPPDDLDVGDETEESAESDEVEEAVEDGEAGHEDVEEPEDQAVAAADEEEGDEGEDVDEHAVSEDEADAEEVEPESAELGEEVESDDTEEQQASEGEAVEEPEEAEPEEAEGRGGLLGWLGRLF